MVVEEITEFSPDNFPLIYLGFPTSHKKKKETHFFELLKKVHTKLQSWKGKMLFFDSKVVLI